MASPFRKSTRVAWFLYIALFATITVLDLWTKAAVFDLLQVENVGDPPAVISQQRVDIIPKFFQLEANYNYGAFNGWFARHTEVLTILSGVALLVITGILAYTLAQHRKPRLLFTVALGLIAGGTAGNLYDRAVLQAVRDWIKWYVVIGEKEYVWPNFNIADSAICVGVVLLILLELVNARAERKARRTGAATRAEVPGST